MRKLFQAAMIVAAAATAVPALAQDQVIVQFGWLAGGDRAAFYLAQQNGLFAEENLDVQLLPGNGSASAITRVATGAAHIAEAGLDTLLTAKLESDIPVTAVMPIYSRAPDGLATTESSGITSLADLAGRTVATSPFTSSNGPWPLILELNGVDPASVNMINADAAALPAMLATGQVDAIIQYVTNSPATGAILEEAGESLVMIPWADSGLDGYSASILVNDGFLAENRDVVVRFVRAFKRGEEMMREDPDAAAAAVVAAVPEIDLAITTELAHITLPLIFNENTEAAGLGVFDPARVETTWEWVARQNDIALDTLDPLDAVDFGIAEEQ